MVTNLKFSWLEDPWWWCCVLVKSKSIKLYRLSNQILPNFILFFNTIFSKKMWVFLFKKRIYFINVTPRKDTQNIFCYLKGRPYSEGTAQLLSGLWVPRYQFSWFAPTHKVFSIRWPSNAKHPIFMTWRDAIVYHHKDLKELQQL